MVGAKVCAVCMEAYNPPDDILARAYLAFARTRGNGQTESRCVKGLIRCAKAGMTGEIIRALVHEDCEGYNELLSTGAGLHIAGGMRTYTRSVCDALDSLKEQGKRTSAARTCVVGLLRASLSSSEDMRWLTDLNQFRQGHRPFYGDREEGIASLVRHLKEANLAGSGIHWLASQLVAGKPSDGAIALAECLLAHDDELSHFFIEHVLTVAAACKASAFADDSNLRRFEELAFTRCKEWLQQQLPSVLITNGTPNNYVLDVLRRRHRDFVSRVRETLSVVIKSEDAVCLLRALAEHCGNESVKLLGEQIGFVSERISDVARVRSAALQLLERALVKTNASIASDTRKAVLLRMHAAFEDTLEVRLLAYSMATALADPITISPLRDRQSTDKDPDAQAKIAAALGAIRQKLLVERPAMTDDSGLVVWLGQVGTLADSALSEKVEELLALPHRATRFWSRLWNASRSFPARKPYRRLTDFSSERRQLERSSGQHVMRRQRFQGAKIRSYSMFWPGCSPMTHR